MKQFCITIGPVMFDIETGDQFVSKLTTVIWVWSVGAAKGCME
jgi:hypothetical protein